MSSGELFIRKCVYNIPESDVSLKDLWRAYKDWWTTDKKLYPWAQAMNLVQFTTALNDHYGKPVDGETYRRIALWDWYAEEDEEAKGT